MRDGNGGVHRVEHRRPGQLTSRRAPWLVQWPHVITIDKVHAAPAQSSKVALPRLNSAGVAILGGSPRPDLGLGEVPAERCTSNWQLF